MLKRVPILTGGFGAQGSSASPAAHAPRSACAPASGFRGAQGAHTQHSNCSPAGRPLCPSLLCTEPVRRPPPFHTQLGRPRGPAAHVQILAALALLRSLGGWLRLSLLIPEGKRIVPASWKVEFFHVKSLCSAWRVGNTPQTLAAAI